jgi:hypothetical protein
MRKLTIFFVSIAFSFAVVNAQELVNKKGFTLLPESGDIALGFDAVPFFDFMLNTANIMNNTGQTAQHPGFVSGFSNVIVGKYFLEDNMAVRGKIGINTLRTKDVDFFWDPADVLANPTDPDSWGELSDIEKNSSSEIMIGAGIELRRGHNRLQGFYGGELLIGFESSSSVYEYGVDMDTDAITNGWVPASRMLKNKSGSDIWVGLRGFVGVEYFFAPKISVGAEFGWGLGFASYSRGMVEMEEWNATDNVSETEVYDGTWKGTSFGFGVDDGISKFLSPSAALNLYFHF